MSNQPSFKIGADPELFLVDDSGTKFISAHDRIPGNKREPHKVANGAIQPDGLAAEFNIGAVDYTNFRAFDSNLTEMLNEVRKTAGDDVFISRKASVVFPKEYYESLPASAKELGCDPDYCAYSDEIDKPNPRPDGSSGLRSAAGHIHIGWGDDIPVMHPEHLAICRSFVKQLDLYVGVGMTIFDDDTERRKLYGKAGAYRPKSYGVEYRTPSNAWIFSRARRQFVHNLIVAAINDMKKGNPKFALFEGGDPYGYGTPRDIIDSGDAAAARQMMTAVLGINIPANL